MERSLYDVLGVNPSASAEEIEAACIKLGEQFSPERNKGNLTATIRFKEIEQAYETLSDPEKRAAYDQKQKPDHSSYKNSSSEPVKRINSGLTGIGVITVTIGVIFLLSAIFHSAITGYGTAIFTVIGLAAVIGANIWLKKKYIQHSGSSTQSPLTSSAVYGFVLIGLIVGYATAVAIPSTWQSKNPPPKSATAPKAATKNSDAALDSCFITGKLAAEVYITNFVEMATNDYLATDLMRDVCAKKGETAPDQNSCVNTCVLGFKAAARKALK